MGKKTKKHTRNIDRKVTWWTADASGPFQRSMMGNRWFFPVVHPDTWCEVGFGRTKAEAERYIMQHRALWEKESGIDMNELRTDRGGEWMSSHFQAWCAEVGMKRSFTAPDSSSGRAENKIKTLQGRARAFCNAAAAKGHLDLTTYDYLWDEAIHYANQVDWMMPSSSPALDGVSPWEHRFGEPPPLKRLHPWGCKAVAHVTNPGKFRNKGRLCMFLGLAKNADDGFRLLDFSTRSIFHSRSVTFYDTLFFGESERGRSEHNAEDSDIASAQQRLLRELNGDEPLNGAQNEEERQPEEEEFAEQHLEQEFGRPARARTQTGHFDPHLWQEQFERDIANMADDALLTAHSRRGPWRTESIGDSRPRLPSGMVPSTYDEAKHAEDREFWRDAIEEEKASLHGARVMRKIKRSKIPPTRKAISCKWVFDIKMKDGVVERYKARLVAKGFLQRQGLDFTDTFAPTPSLASVRLVIALALQLGFQVHHQDVKTAFLIPSLPEGERVYMEPPRGFDIDSEYCMELLKCLYGLRQSASKWNEEIDDLLRNHHFFPLDADPCVYAHYTKTGEVDCIIAVHVDDILIAAGETMLARTKQLLGKHYSMKDLGELSWYLGIKVTFSPDRQSVELSQRAFALDILRQYRMEKANHRKVPIIPSPRPLTLEQLRDLKPWMAEHKYRAIVGALQYLTLTTRPDLAVAVGFAARHTANPQPEDWQALKQILGYLAGTVDYGLVYHKHKDALIVGSSDSDWAGDKSDRKSTSGFAFIYAGAAISWKCKKQSIVARSTAEAEIVALDLAAREGLWLRKLTKALFLKEHPPLVIHEDNEAAIAISRKHQRTARTKHIDIQFFAICDDVAHNRIVVSPVASADNVADIFTKPLDVVKFQKFRSALGLRRCKQQ